MLVSCRQPNGAFPEATATNARLMVESSLGLLPKPRFSMDIVQTTMVKRYNNATKAYDLWDFVRFDEGDSRNAPSLKPEDGEFVLQYRDGTWRIVSNDYFAEIYA